MSLPQNASNRYINNLLTRGKNDDFELVMTDQEHAVHDGIVVGTYYTVSVRKRGPNADAGVASGVTPTQAARRCLKKFGVTFRE